MTESSEFYRSNFTYIVEIYKRFTQDASSVDASWKRFFQNLAEDEKLLMQDAAGAPWEINKSAVIGRRNELSSLTNSEVLEILSLEKAQEKKKKEAIALAMKEKGFSTGSSLDDHVLKLIAQYRSIGHLSANLDPLGISSPYSYKGKSPKMEDITTVDIEKEVTIMGMRKKVSEIIKHFKNVYTEGLGAEIDHIKVVEEKDWLYDSLENYQLPSNISEVRKENLENLIKAESFEHALHLKFPGAKRFSLEGGETTIIALENILLKASEDEVVEVVVGMAHRGRLNVLTHVLGKPYHALFSEFMGVSSIPEGVPGQGDVKYHLGLSKVRKLSNGKEIYISLTPNPSHLEAVNPVVMGRARAKQDLKYDFNRKKVLPILIHGDAAMAGQGVVAECLAMGGLKGYNVGGTLHIVINNQVGFTATATDTKSSTYSTDVAKMIDAPIFHVNGNDTEAVMKAAVIAIQYRQKFKKDVVLEIICYRKYGHNEGDEPLFTQPVMYAKIKEQKTPATIYGEFLRQNNAIPSDFEDIKRKEIKEILDKEHEKAKSYKPTKADWLEGEWSSIKRLEDAKDLNNFKDTSFSKIDTIGGSISMPPEKFNLNSKIHKLLDERKSSLLAGDKIDWATGELLAYGSLLMEGIPVRLSGEDCERGTFSHRHSVYYDQTNGERYEPLNNIKSSSVAKYSVYNSLLSEFAVLGFEYGYSITTPNSLVLWEAQFGDFANGAVTIYDQFISSGEDKWLRMSGLVSLLPHGYEGQGPEHSSARLERYLQYAAENNIIVCNITTPANLFHVLRRQVKMPFRKPLIIMTPKSLLRHHLVKSSISEFTNGSFKTIIGDTVQNYKTAKRIIFTSGKVYYDLLEMRESVGKTKEIAIIRIEQYYPFDSDLIKKEIAKYLTVKEYYWLQEEPRNMGAWSFLRDYLEDAANSLGEVTNSKIIYVGRKANASPATGFASVHAKEQKEILTQALK